MLRDIFLSLCVKLDLVFAGFAGNKEECPLRPPGAARITAAGVA